MGASVMTVVRDLIVVTLDKDGRLTAIGDVIATRKIVVTGQINPNENQGIRNVIGLNFVMLSSRVDADLVCGDGVVFNVDIIRLEDQYAGSVKRAVFERHAGRPHVVCDGIPLNASRSAEADLDAILRCARCWTKASDNIVGDSDFSSQFIAGDSILLIVVDTVVVDGDLGGFTAEALHDDGITALAAVERNGEFGVTHGIVFDTARGILVQDADEVRGALGYAAVRGVHDEAFDFDIRSILDEDGSGYWSAGRAGGVCHHIARQHDRAVVAFDA